MASTGWRGTSDVRIGSVAGTVVVLRLAGRRKPARSSQP